VEWIRAWLSPEVAGKVVAIDGKSLRGSHDGGQSSIHLVSAFGSEAGIVLGQIKTSEQSNEITAIPELLEWLNAPRSATVTMIQPVTAPTNPESPPHSARLPTHDR